MSRKLGERIVVGDGVTCPRIEILVVDIDRGKVRIGVTAPRDVPVMREELLPIRPQAVPPDASVPPHIPAPAEEIQEE